MNIHVDKCNGPFKVNIAKLFTSTIKFVSSAISPIPGSGNFNLPVSWINIMESSFTPVLSKHPRFKLLQLYVNFNLEYLQNHHFSLYCWHFNLSCVNVLLGFHVPTLVLFVVCRQHCKKYRSVFHIHCSQSSEMHYKVNQHKIPDPYHHILQRLPCIHVCPF